MPASRYASGRARDTFGPCRFISERVKVHFRTLFGVFQDAAQYISGLRWVHFWVLAGAFKGSRSRALGLREACWVCVLSLIHISEPTRPRLI
eukprot:530323-Rhodomonas_salina.1